MNINLLDRRDFLHLAALASMAGLLLTACSARQAPRTPTATPAADTLAPVGSARRDAWRVIGPGGGGAMFSPAVSPHDPHKAFVCCDMTGAYVTEDGGSSWRMFNLRGVVKFIAFDPSDPLTIYAYSSALWRSRDGGLGWGLVYPYPASVTKIIQVGDHAMETFLTAGGPAMTVHALAVDPADSRTLYAVLSAGEEVTLFTSTDAGQTWLPSEPLPNGATGVYVDAASPQADRTLYVIGLNSVSVRKGGRWLHQAPPQGVHSFNCASGAFLPGGQLMVYAVTGRTWDGGDETMTGICVSRDGGANWEVNGAGFLSAAPEGKAQVELRAVAACASQPDTAYLSYKDVTTGMSSERLTMGVVKTIDGGKRWEFVWKDTYETPAANIHDAWINARFGPMWGENPFDLAVAPTNPEICYGTDFGRTMRTLDGGKIWEGVYARPGSGVGWASTGLDVTTCYDVCFDPFDPQHLLVPYTDMGLFQSFDGGQSWSSATESGVPREWLNSCYWVAFDPHVKGLVWAAMSDVHDLPRPKMWKRSGVGGYKGGVLVSTDGGKNWKKSSKGMPQAAPTHILLDPASPVNRRTLYVCALGRGVYKSTDNGASWKLKNKGLEGASPLVWRLERAPGGVLYLVAVRRSDDGSFGDENDGALYRSDDGAESWVKLPLPAGCNGPTSLVVDPQNERHLLLSAWGVKNAISGDTGGGIFHSMDGGQTWACALERDQHIHDLTCDPLTAAFYACGFESNAFCSTDAGKTWQRIKGYNFKWGRRVIPDPQNPGMVYITTFGGSIWYGPAAGDPTAAEDILTPEAAY